MATSQDSLIIKRGDSRFSNMFWPFLYKKRMGTNIVFFAKLGSKVRGKRRGFKENSISV